MPAGDIEARQKLTARAILLERAEQTLRDVYQGGVLTDATLHTVVSFLRYQAQAWRQEAERG